MIRDLLTKKPFVKITPSNLLGVHATNDRFTMMPCSSDAEYDVLRQSDFIREYYPSGHKINSPIYYPNKIKYDEEKQVYVEQKVIRVSMPFQYLITAQQLVHLCGNDIHFELPTPTPTEKEKETLRLFQQGWLEKNMETVFYYFAKSVLVTGDGAVVQYLDKEKVKAKVLSFMYGDKIYPHFNSLTGELDLFAREYTDYDESGKAVTSHVEVWDRTHLTRYRQSLKGVKSAVARIKEAFNLEGYIEISRSPHGFMEIPVAYSRREEGACWSLVQDCIDKYELAVSHLCQNNMAYAFPIMVLKGDEVNVQANMDGSPKFITMGREDEALFLSAPQSPESFKLQLETLLKMIFLGSFTVTPPEVKSGDLPGVAIKLIYSPSMDKAIIDSKEFDDALDKMVRIFKYGYGTELGKSSSFNLLKPFAWIEPYVHSNTAELINNLAMGVQNGFISVETASRKSTYDEPDELVRLIKEKKETDMADRLEPVPQGMDEAT